MSNIPPTMPTPPIPLPSTSPTLTTSTLFQRRDLCDDYNYSPYGCNWRNALFGTLAGLSIILFAFLVYRFIIVPREDKSHRARQSDEQARGVDLEQGSAFASTERSICEIPPAYAVRAAGENERTERLPKYEPPMGRP